MSGTSAPTQTLTLPVPQDIRVVIRPNDAGPFDIIGDVHGCADELAGLFELLGYTRDGEFEWRPPAGRRTIFLGDLVDRGPKNVAALKIAMAMVRSGHALAVPGNHDIQLERYLAGEDVPLAFGLDVTVAELERESEEFRRTVLEFLQTLPSHYLLDDGRLLVAHTGLPADMHGVDSNAIRHYAAYGVLPGEPNPSGDPAERHLWIDGYTGTAMVIHGHTPVRDSVWKNNTLDIDAGCVFGGRLLAFRWPEKDLVAVPARQQYVRPPRHFQLT